MFELRKKIEIKASQKSVWEILIDLEHWQDWTASISSIERLDTRPLGVGTQVKIQQPKLPLAVWTITTWEPEKSFEWVTRKTGIITRASHTIISTENGSVLELVVEFRGLFGGFIGRLTSELTTKYLSFESEGLKNRCEQNK